MEGAAMSFPAPTSAAEAKVCQTANKLSSLTVPLQELTSLFSRPLTSLKVAEPMEQAAHCGYPGAPAAFPAASRPGPPPPVHIEVCQVPYSTLRSGQIKELVRLYLKGLGNVVGEMHRTEFEDPALKQHVASIRMTDVPDDQCFDPLSTCLLFHVYQLHDDGPMSEELEEDCDVSAASHWMLPSAEFDGLWESLVYEVDIKQKLLRYAETTLVFSDRGVDSNVVSCNRVVLLHGPPGTGKTSLCKALAQKLCIRLSKRFSYGQLVEINSHSLFSKWFSESGKLVQKMFSKIQDLIEDPDALVFVLMDEVESLTAARKAAMTGSEPSDAIRVVNALLTQLDYIRRYPNVIILTTSNVTGAIDLAFVDRADIKQYIGLPTLSAIFKIYLSCITELLRVGIISSPKHMLDMKCSKETKENDSSRFSLRLKQIASKSEGLSGRTLRKIPFLAYSLCSEPTTLSLESFLEVLEKAVSQQFIERELLNKD